MTAPCLDCTDRKIGCHATCAKYIEYNENNIKLRAKRKAEKDGGYLISNYLPHYVFNRMKGKK